MPIPDSVSPQAVTAPSQRLHAQIADALTHAGGWLSFARYMHLALYAPGVGYYTGGGHKLGAGGDFTTAPESSLLFGACVAAQVAEVLAQVSDGVVIEAGAGSGALAVSVLQELEALGRLPVRYEILEVSPSLAVRQRERIAAEVPHLAARVHWLTAPPERFSGVLLANEVLDAMPVHRVLYDGQGGVWEDGVALDAQGRLCWQPRPLSGALARAVEELPLPRHAGVPIRTEVGLAARDWVRDWGERLAHGAMLLIDYGYPRDEYYLLTRQDGTLACYREHRYHTDPFDAPGQTDITASVEFTAVAEAAYSAGLDILGYTSQAAFLFNCGLAEQLARFDDAPETERFEALRGAQMISDLREMGETFKVFAAGRGLQGGLMSFSRHDRTHTL